MQKRIPLALAPLGLVAAVITASLLAGCNNPNVKWVGTWTGEMTGLAPEIDSVEANTLRKVELIIRGDATFDLRKGPLPVSGNIEFGGTSSRLKVTHILDRPVESQPDAVVRTYSDLRVNYEPDGTLRLIDRFDFGRPPVTLTKEESPSEQP